MKYFLILLVICALAACQPTATPTPTAAPTAEPTEESTEAPTEEATEVPTEEATEAPTEEATEMATEEVEEAATEAATEMAIEEAEDEATAESTEEAATDAEFAFDPIQSVCLITDIGRVNDGTFNQFAFEGMDRAVQEFGLETTYIETQAQTDYEANINTCLDEGYDALVVVGFSITDAMVAAARTHPDILFIGIDMVIEDNPDTPEDEAPINAVGVQFREDQAGFLVGAMAAMMTESGTVAGVYGIDIPPVVKFRNGYEQGARYINPDINVLGVYIDDFQAPDRGAAAAEQFIGQGADVIFGAGGPTGSGAIAFAASEGVLVIGVDQDEYFTTFGGGETPGAEYLISSAMKRVDNGVYQLLTAAVSGDEAQWPTDSIYVLEVANDGITFAPPHDANVPQEVTDQVTAILEGLRDGSITTGVDPVTGDLLEPIEGATEEAEMEATEEAETEATEEPTEEATP
jgi:basic membrane lipoprotein Med (substrate-binding protein (PBP1-ABC) superfamily)